MGECPFCTVSPSRILLESESAIAIFDGFPVSEGHTLVVPRRHVASVYDLTSSEQQALWDLVAETRGRLLSDFNADGFNIGFNDGLAAGQTVTSATFTATASSVNSNQSATISAQYGGNTAQAQLTVTPAPAGTTISFSMLEAPGVVFQPIGHAATVGYVLCTPDAGNVVINCSLGLQYRQNSLDPKPMDTLIGTIALKGSSSDHGTTFLFTQLDPARMSGAAWFDSNSYTFSSASLSFTLTQTQITGGFALGSLNGTLSVTIQSSTGSAITFSGVIGGQYVATQ
jgi:hypothetical protein